MLRINLLPSYVTQRRLTKRLIVAFAVAAVFFVLAPLAFYAVKQKELTDLTAKAAAAEAGKAKTDASRALAASTLAQVDPIKAKLDFVTAVLAYPKHWVQLYNTLADTTPRQSFIYSGTTVAAPTMTIKAYSPSVAEVGRYLQAMYREPDFSTVVVDKVPAYPDNVRNLYYYGKTLVFADNATGGGTAGGGQGGYPGGSPFGGGRPTGGYPTGGGGAGGLGTGAGAPPDYNTTALGPNSPGNIPPGVGPPPPELTGGISTTGGGGPQGGPQSGGAAAAGGYGVVYDRVAGGDISPFALPEVRQSILRTRLRRVVKRTVPRGFDITVTATLKDETVKTLTPPAPPGSAPAAAPGGLGGPGGRGGFPGAPLPPGVQPTG